MAMHFEIDASKFDRWLGIHMVIMWKRLWFLWGIR